MSAACGSADCSSATLDSRLAASSSRQGNVSARRPQGINREPAGAVDGHWVGIGQAARAEIN